MRAAGLSVEFLGLPGAGKSTLAHRTAEILAARGLVVEEPTWKLSHVHGRVSRLATKLGWVAVESMAQPVYAMRTFRMLRASRQSARRYVAREALNWLMVTAALRRRLPPGTIRILDQGIFQAVWSIALEARMPVLARFDPDLARALPLPDVAVVVEANLDAVIRRLQRRSGKGSRVDSWSPDDATAFERARALHDDTRLLLERLSRERGGVRIVTVRNDDDAIDRLANRLAADLAALASGSGAASPRQGTTDRVTGAGR